MADFPLEIKPVQRALLVGLQTPEMAAGEGEELLGELHELVENLNIEITNSTFLTLRQPQPKFLIGRR
jgi:GTP-binding protein HflX